MVQITSPEGKEQVMTAFSKLLATHQNQESRVATKEEEAEKAKNSELLTKATAYTVDNIVNGMAALQLDFGSAVDLLKENLTTESSKLEELKKAIAVERANLKQLSQVRLVADALHILEQEHQAKLRQITESTKLEQEKIDREINQTRQEWEQEAADFLATTTEADELLAQQRAQEAADYNYELARQRTIEADEYAEDQRQQERELAEAEQEKAKDWAKREQYLSENQAKFAKQQTEIAGFEEKIKTEYNKAKGDAIAEATKKAKVETDLLEKDWSARQKGFDFQIESLSETLTRQEQQIADLKAQLQESNTQSQNLALRAFNN